MFLTPHAAVAVALTQSIDNPIVAFIIGFLSHFVLDVIPHGDAEFGPWMARRKNRIDTLILLVAIDLALSIALITTLFNHLPPWPVVAIGAALGSMVPDVLWGLSDVFPLIRPLQSFKRFHNSLHLFLPDRVSFRTGMLIQLVTLVVAIAFMR